MLLLSFSIKSARNPGLLQGLSMSVVLCRICCANSRVLSAWRHPRVCVLPGAALDPSDTAASLAPASLSAVGGIAKNKWLYKKPL